MPVGKPIASAGQVFLASIIPLLTEILAKRHSQHSCGSPRMRPVGSNGGAMIKTFHLLKILLTSAAEAPTAIPVDVVVFGKVLDDIL